MGYLLTALTTMLVIVLGIYAWPLIRAHFFPTTGTSGSAMHQQR